MQAGPSELAAADVTLADVTRAHGHSLGAALGSWPWPDSTSPPGQVWRTVPPLSWTPVPWSSSVLLEELIQTETGQGLARRQPEDVRGLATSDKELFQGPCHTHSQVPLLTVTWLEPGEPVTHRAQPQGHRPRA